MSNDAELLYFQGLKKHREKDYDGAVELLKQAVDTDPTYGDAWEALGVLYEKTDRLDDAIASMEKLLELNPNEIMAHTNLSRFYMKKGWTEKAEEAQGKARLIGWKKELAEGGGEDDFQQAPGNEGPSEAPVTLAGLATGGGPAPIAPAAPDLEQLQKKVDQFQAILDVNPDDTMARLTLGKTFLQMERYDDAAQVLEEAIALQEDYTAAYVVLGDAYQKNGKLARAIKTFKKGVELAAAKGDLHPRNQMQERLAALTGGGSPS